MSTRQVISAYTIFDDESDFLLSNIEVVRSGRLKHGVFEFDVDLWAVRSRGRCLNSKGEWDWEPLPSSRSAAWLSAHRFPLDRALDLAREATVP